MKTVKLIFAVTSLCCLIAALCLLWSESKVLSTEASKVLITLFMLLAMASMREYFLTSDLKEEEEE